MLQELQLSVQAPISDWCMKKKKSWNYCKYKFQLLGRSLVRILLPLKEPYIILCLCAIWLNLKDSGKTERLVFTPLPFLVSGSTSRVKHYPVSQESSIFFMLLICFLIK